MAVSRESGIRAAISTCGVACGIAWAAPENYSLKAVVNLLCFFSVSLDGRTAYRNHLQQTEKKIVSGKYGCRHRQGRYKMQHSR